MSGIQAKICLPLSRPSTTRYAQETRGALRMIWVSVFSNDLMIRVMPRGAMPGYIAHSLQCEPMDQTDLRNGIDAIYESVGESP
jgi:hypothetical protein